MKNLIVVIILFQMVHVFGMDNGTDDALALFGSHLPVIKELQVLEAEFYLLLYKAEQNKKRKADLLTKKQAEKEFSDTENQFRKVEKEERPGDQYKAAKDFNKLKTISKRLSCAAMHPSIRDLELVCLDLKKYVLGLKLTRDFDGKKKRNEHIREFMPQDNIRLISRSTSCLKHKQLQDEQERRDRELLQQKEQEKHQQLIQERKPCTYRFKQNQKQEQKRLNQQLRITQQKNKKLPKSQRQVMQIAHRKKW